MNLITVKYQNHLMETNIQLKEETAKWLDAQDWDFFCTFTTRYSLTQKAARRAMERLYDRMTQKWGGSRFFWASEPFDCKEGFHTHGLIHLNDRKWKDLDIDFDAIRLAWKIVSRGGTGKESNFTTLKRYKKGKGASGYCGKYIMKTGADYDWYDQNSQLRPDQISPYKGNA